jgi:hypothetical protein
MSDILGSLLDLLRIPLSFLPTGVLMFFDFVSGFFAIYVCAKLLRWLWDILPLA